MMVAPASQTVLVSYQASGTVTGGYGNVFDAGAVALMDGFQATWTWDTEAMRLREPWTRLRRCRCRLHCGCFSAGFSVL